MDALPWLTPVPVTLVPHPPAAWASVRAVTCAGTPLPRTLAGEVAEQAGRDVLSLPMDVYKAKDKREGECLVVLHRLLPSSPVSPLLLDLSLNRKE